MLRSASETDVTWKGFYDFETRTRNTESSDGFGDEALEVRRLVTFRADDFDGWRRFCLEDSARRIDADTDAAVYASACARKV
jgi:hypothetical protein